MIDVPYDDDTRSTVYRVDAFVPDGGARDDVALVLYDTENQPVARQIFDARELDNAPMAGPGVADWLRDVVNDLLNSEGRETCADCGNRFNGTRPHGGHAADCDYAVD